MFKLSHFLLILTALTIPLSNTLSSSFWALLSIPGLYFMIKSFRLGEFRFSERSQIALLCLILTIVISLLLNWNEHSEPIRGLKKVRYLIFSFLNYYAILELSKKNIFFVSTLKKTFLAFTCSVSASTLYALFSYWQSYDFVKNMPKDFGGRLAGFTGIMNYGYETPVALFLFLSCFIIYKHKLLIPAVVLNFVGILSSGTRGGIIAMIVSFLPLIFFTLRRHFSKVAVFYIICTFSGFAYLYTTKTPIGEVSSKSRSLSNQLRYQAILASIEAFKDKPLLGNGLYNRQEKYKIGIELDGEYYTPYGEGLQITENTYLQILVNAGLFGLVSFAFFIYFWIKSLLKANWPISAVFMPAIICYLIGAIFLSTFVTGSTTAVLIGMLYTLSLVFSRIEEKKVT